MIFEKTKVFIWDDVTKAYTKEFKWVWRAETAEGRFTAPDTMTGKEVIAAKEAGLFKESKFKTSDGRPVFTLPFRPEVAEAVETSDDIKVGGTPVYKSVKITYLD